MTTYLVTGGAGFIGASVCEKLLKENNKVIVIDNFCDFYDPQIKENNIKEFKSNSNFKLYRNDILDRQALKQLFEENKIDTVIHLAARASIRQSIENPCFYQEINGLGTQNILEEMKNHNVKNLIIASSSSVYGNCKQTPFKEDMVTDFPISPYAATKKANEIMAYVYHKLYDFNVMVLRFFTVYGPKQRPDLAISKFTRLMLNNEEIPMFGNGESSRDYTYIDDIVDGVFKSCNYIESNKNVYEIINLGNSLPIPLKEMIYTISRILNINPIIKQLPMQPGDIDITYADITKANKMLGYKPQVSFDEGINRFVNWFKEDRKMMQK